MGNVVDAFASGARSNRLPSHGKAFSHNHGLDVLLLRLAETAALALEEPVHARGAVLLTSNPQFSRCAARSSLGDVGAPGRRVLFVAIRNDPHARLPRRGRGSRRRTEDVADRLVDVATRASAAVHGSVDSGRGDAVRRAWRAEMRRLLRPLDRCPGVFAVRGRLCDRSPILDGRNGKPGGNDVQALSISHRAGHHCVPVAR